ncbi:unnamed protein product [Mytilus coruscus]|uniref:Core-binding (CB) domain-containing protein n=1 Tax=Mytilus coruscus TaxID=42192 RepID=A0A6J8D8Y3_MYTCO|nr:unnamed protein product [Mytilus coruscus]
MSCVELTDSDIISPSESDFDRPKLKVALFGRKSRCRSPFNLTSDSTSSEDSRPRPALTRKPIQKRKRRIRPSKKCNLCGTQQKNIWRHMKNVHDGVTKTKKVVSPRHYVVRICPISDCCKLVERMRDHLVRTHHIQNRTPLLKRLLARAEPLTEDIEDKKEDNKEDIVIIISDEETCEVKKENPEEPGPGPSGLQKTRKRKMLIKKKKKKDNKKCTTVEISDDETKLQKGTRKRNKTMITSSEDETFFDSMPTNVSSDDESQIEMQTTSEEDEEEKLKSWEYVNRFAEWLQSPPLMRAKKDAQQHARQVLAVWIFMSPTLSLDELYNVEQLHAWLQQFLEEKSPGTARSYLSSVTSFVEFLMIQGLVKGMNAASRFKENIKLLSRSLAKPLKRRKTEIEAEDLATMITPEDMTSFINSPLANDCDAILNEPKPRPIVKSTFYNLRNFLLLRLLQVNAQRPSAVMAVSSNILNRAKITEEGAILTVAHHKTSESGPANLGLTTLLYQQLNRFVQLCELIPNFVPDANRSIFVCWPSESGEITPMTSSNINRAIQKVWSSSSEKSISATRLRKATATAVRMAVPESREVLAAHMTHAVATSDRYYNIAKTRDNAIPVTKLIDSIMCPGRDVHVKDVNEPKDGNKEEDVNEEKVREMDEDNPMPVSHLRICVMDGPKDIKQSIHWPKDNDKDKDKNIEQPEKNERNKTGEMNEQPIVMVKGYARENVKQNKEAEVKDREEKTKDSEKEKYQELREHKRRSFLPEEAKTLLKLCKQNIETENLTCAAIISTLQETAEGLAFLLLLKDKFNDQTTLMKKVTDRVRTEARRRKSRSSW